MLVSMNDVLKIAERKKIAIGAFNVTDWESAEAIIQAAEETGKAVILNYAPIQEIYISLEDAAEIMLYFAKKAKVPVAVNLDHGDSFDRCMQAMRLGFTAVMIDASAKPYEENVAETAAVVRAAHAMGVSVEAEVGHIFSSVTGKWKKEQKVETSDSFEDLNDVYTRPETAKDFHKKTNVDALAIAFGTAHGIYTTKPKLDLERIKQIRAAVKMPFVMHGGSGLTKEQFQTAIKNGIRKINYHTYMVTAGGKAVKAALDKMNPKDHVFFYDIPGIAIKAMKENVKEAILIFSNEI